MGVTTGGPIAIAIENRDHENWRQIMDVAPGDGGEPVTRPRPGHADLAGVLKYGLGDIRDVIERASARETAARTAAGAVARVLLRELGICVRGHVTRIGSVTAGDVEDIGGAELSPVRCADPAAEQAMMAEIDRAKEAGDTAGGVVEVRASGVMPGLGGYGQWDQRLDGRLAAAVMSIPGIKGVEIGLGFGAASLPGSQVHDAITPGTPPVRPTNSAGGIEGGVTTGQPIVIRAAMKPIPTLVRPLPTVDLRTGLSARAHAERSDTCAVPACCVVVEAAAAWELARAVTERFGGDRMDRLQAAVDADRG